MKKIFTTGLAMLAFIFANSQVGINTTTPNGATVLDIHSNEKGILVPRLSGTERDTKLADNDPATVPPTGVVNSNLTSGTLIFNTTANRFEFWDGRVWRQLFVATSSQAGNDGVVRIDGQNGSATDKPTLTNVGQSNGFGNEKQVMYNGALKFAPSPTTSWPETITSPVDSDIYLSTGGKFRENPINGQVHIWRIIIKLTAGASSSGSVMASLRNPDSGFQVTSVQLIPSGSSSGSILTFYFYTIADPFSLNPGKGYQLWMDANKVVNIEVESVTRVSLFKD